MKIVRTTPAMSLLYECINGIIQGGFFEDSDGVPEREDTARLCVSKLCDMLAVEGDPNCREFLRPDDEVLKYVAVKYVALLAFQKIATSHPHLAAGHQEIIFGCLDDLDISIRLQALKIGSQMIDSTKLPSIVARLVQQLHDASTLTNVEEDAVRKESIPIEPSADSDGEDPAENLRSQTSRSQQQPPIPAEYQFAVINEVLDMCARDSFANIDDFEWYIRTLVDLLRYIPHSAIHAQSAGSKTVDPHAVSSKIGIDLRSIAVRVPSIRAAVVQAANSLLAAGASETWSAGSSKGALAHAAWIVGEYADVLPSSEEALNYFTLLPLRSLESESLSICLQAVPKVLASTFRQRGRAWDSRLQSSTSLLLARMNSLLEPLAKHTDLEVQERAVECLELVRLSAEAAASHDPRDSMGPTVLAEGIPLLYQGFELNPVATTAQRKVPLPDELDFARPLNSSLSLHLAQQESFSKDLQYESGRSFYFQRPPVSKLVLGSETASNALEKKAHRDAEEALNTLEGPIPGRTGRRHKGRPDDPFYINSHKDSFGPPKSDDSGPLKGSGVDLDLDSIPIMALGIGDTPNVLTPRGGAPAPSHPEKHRFHVAAEENIDVSEPARIPRAPLNPTGKRRAQESLLQIDSSGIGRLDLAEDVAIDLASKREEEEEMAKALADVEKMRMEMQRTSERVTLAGTVTPEGAMVKKKAKKKRRKLARPTDSPPLHLEGAKEHSSN